VTALERNLNNILNRILSVRPSVTRVDCDKMLERSVQISMPYESTFSLVF